MSLKKKWYCSKCGQEFETPWIPSQFVTCPNCGADHKFIFRVDEFKGKGFGNRFRRKICKRL